MACFKTLQREQEAIAYNPNSSGTAKLQRNYNYSFILFDLVVNYTAAAGAKFKYLNFANLIKSFQVFANGSTEFKNINFNQLVYMTYLYSKGKLLSAPPAITEGSHTHTLRVMVPFASLLMMRPSDTGLMSNIYQTLDYLVNWASAESVGTGITIQSAQLKPTSFEKIESLSKDDAPVLRLIQKLQSEQITTNTNGYLINVPPLKQYQNFQFDLLKGSDGSAAPGCIKNIKFLNGTDVVAQLSVESLKAFNKARYDIDDEAFKKLFSAEIAANQVLNPDAHFVLNFSDVGHYSNSKDLSGFTMPQIAVDTDLSSIGGAALALNICATWAE